MGGIKNKIKYGTNRNKTHFERGEQESEANCVRDHSDLERGAYDQSLSQSSAKPSLMSRQHIVLC